MSTALMDSGSDYQTWLERGRELARGYSDRQFAIGDWLVEGEDSKWSRKVYADAADIFAGCYPKETLYIFVSVARAVEILTRIKVLSWAHHRAIARFGTETQRQLLDYAVKHDLSLRNFQSYIKEKFPPTKPTSNPETMQNLDTTTSSDDWKIHWQGMPEFIVDDLTPFQTIKVHFQKQDDVNKFAELVGQKITPQTRFIWYPEAKKNFYAGKQYVDAEPEPEDEITLPDGEAATVEVAP